MWDAWRTSLDGGLYEVSQQLFKTEYNPTSKRTNSATKEALRRQLERSVWEITGEESAKINDIMNRDKILFVRTPHFWSKEGIIRHLLSWISANYSHE